MAENLEKETPLSPEINTQTESNEDIKNTSQEFSTHKNDELVDKCTENSNVDFEDSSLCLDKVEQLEEDEIFSGDVRQKIKEVNQDVKKRRSSKGKLWSFLFLLVNLIVTAIIIIVQVNSEDGLAFADLPDLIENGWCLVCAVGAFALFMALESLRYWLLIRRSTGHHRPFLSYKVSAMGMYYDNITPMATGGQPFQIFYMINRGVKPSIASGIPFAKTIFAQLVFVIAGLCVLIFSKIIAGGLPNVTYFAAVMGLIIQFVLTATIFLLSVSKHVGPAIVKGILKLLNKIKIIKNPEQTFVKVMQFVQEYQNTMRYLMSSIWSFLLTGFVSFMIVSVKALIPFFICSAFVGFSIELYGTVFILSILIDLIMSYIPWPGATGIAEVSFSLLFGHQLVGLTGSALVWSMLIWRVLTYYSFLIQGILIILYDFVRGNKKIPITLRRLKRIDAIKTFKKRMPKTKEERLNLKEN